MPRALQVHVNRADHHDVSARTKRFVPEGPFEVRVQNHGAGSHVHVAVTGDLAIADGLPDDNPFLEGGDTLAVAVDVTTDLRPARGTVEVTTGYGRNAVTVDVEVREDGAEPTESAGRSGSPGATAGPTAAGTSGGSTATDASVASSVAALRERLPDGIATSLSSLRATLPSVPAGLGLPARDAGASDAAVGDRSGDDAVTRDAATRDADTSVARSLTPSLDARTALLVALTVLALLTAWSALSLFDGAAVTASAIAVVATVALTAGYLALR